MTPHLEPCEGGPVQIMEGGPAALAGHRQPVNNTPRRYRPAGGAAGHSLSYPFDKPAPGLMCDLAHTSEVFHHVSSSLLGPVDPSYRELSGRLKFAFQRHMYKKKSLSRSPL
jgi:hypothetical protein